MGYSNDPSYSGISPIVVDLETAALPNAADYLEPVHAARNLKDEAKIAADIEARTAERDSKLALDPNVGRIVAIGLWTNEDGIETAICENEREEAEAIAAFWVVQRNRTIVGFNVRGFDLRYLVQRSRYLGLTYPMLDLGKYAKKGIVDLYSELTFGDGVHDQGAMRRTLKAFCKRFGIPVDDTTTGADIAALIASGDWAGVQSHVVSDVKLTVALARKVIPGVMQVDEVGVF